MDIEVEMFASARFFFSCMKSSVHKEKWIRKMKYVLALWMLLAAQTNIKIT